MQRRLAAADRGGGTLDANLGCGSGLAARAVLTPFAMPRRTGHGWRLRRRS